MSDLFWVLLPFLMICLFLPSIFSFSFSDFALILRAKMLENKCLIRSLPPCPSSLNTGVCPGRAISRENYRRTLLQTCKTVPNSPGGASACSVHLSAQHMRKKNREEKGQFYCTYQGKDSFYVPAVMV